MKKTLNIIFNIIIILSIIFILAIVSSLLYLKLSHPLPYKACSTNGFVLTPVECYTDNRETLKKDIDALFGSPYYNMRYVNEMKGNNAGETRVYIRRIDILNGLTDKEFVFILAHELVHLTEFTASERYCHLKAFEKLMDSENEYFEYVAKWWFNTDVCGLIDKDYSFAGYAQDLLK